MRGFTLIEVIITITILVIITTALLPNYNKFSETIGIRREAQEVAYSVREVQASAFAVKGFDHDNNPGTPQVFTAWGININKTNSDRSYDLFVDINSDGRFDAVDHLVRTVDLSRFAKIKDICANTNANPPGPCSRQNVTITYKRPNPDATLIADAAPYDGDIKIILESSSGLERSILVWSSGQITVE